jgi:hypothetical protein
MHKFCASDKRAGCVGAGAVSRMFLLIAAPTPQHYSINLVLIPRCLDPTELGTECGTIKCLTCLKQGRAPPGLVRAKRNQLQTIILYVKATFKLITAYLFCGLRLQTN